MHERNASVIRSLHVLRAMTRGVRARRDEIVHGSSSCRHTLGLASQGTLPERGKGGKDLTIVSALFALLADHVLGVVATARRSYLIEFNRYLDEQQLTDPSKPRSTPA